MPSDRRHLLSLMLGGGLALGWPARRATATPPPARRSLQVAGPLELMQALDGARPGDHLLLEPGHYAGYFELARDGTAGTPIVIRARSPGTAVFSDELALLGAHNIAYQLRGEGEVARISVRGPEGKVLRCSLHGTAQKGGAITVFEGAVEAEIAYNEIRDYSHRGITVRVRHPVPRGAYIHHNHIKGSSSRGADATAALIIGETKRQSERMAEALVEYNLIEDHFTGAGCLEFKSSGNTARFNTLRNCRSRLESRHGRHCRFIGNACLNAMGPIVWGTDHQVIGNYHDGRRSGSWGDIGAGAGTITQDAFVDSDGPQYPRAENCLMVGNIGTLRLGSGKDGWSLPARNITVEQHDGLIMIRNAVDTIENAIAAAGTVIPRHVVLGPTDVGPDAA